jgi:hypothetical protein
MKLKLIKILSIIIIGLIVNSCSVKRDMGKVEDSTIKILNVDSLKFVNYYTCEFKSKSNTEGYLLIKKSKINLTSFDLLISENIRFDSLCDVIEFQPNNSEITFRGHATINGIYEDGELIIDLSDDIEKRYYQLCYGNQIERKN